MERVKFAKDVSILKDVKAALKNSGYAQDMNKGIVDAQFQGILDTGDVLYRIKYEGDDGYEYGQVFLKFRDGKWYGEF